MFCKASDGSCDKPVGVVGPRKKPDVVAKPNVAQMARAAPGSSPVPMVAQQALSDRAAVSETTVQTESLQHDLSSPYANTEPVSKAPIILSRLKLHIRQLSQPVPRADAVKTKDGKRYITDGFEREFDGLPGPDIKQRTVGKTQANLIMNRFKNIQPYDDNRVVLEAVDELQGSDYVNASYIMSFGKHKSIILTQMPLPNTVVDFWRLVYDHECNCIVMLNEMEAADMTDTQYWPGEEISHKSYGPIYVQLVSTEHGSNMRFASRTFKVYNERRTMREEPRTVRQFQLSGWAIRDKVPPQADLFIDLIQNVTYWRRNQEGGSTVVHCRDGAERSGLFAAGSYLLDLMQAEQEVDVMLAARYITSRRPETISTQEQYKFLFEMANSYISGFHTYGNA